MKKMIYLVLAFCMIFALGGCTVDSNVHEGEARTPAKSSSQKGRDYQSVIADFEKQGFINIKTELLEDLIFGWLTKDGEVESVSVDGDKKYLSDKWYSNDVEVIITYHTFPKSKEKIEPDTPKEDAHNQDDNEALNAHEGEAKTPSDSSVQKGRDYQKVIDDFEKNGFVNIKTELLEDLIFGWLTKDGEVESVSVDGDKDYLADKWYSNDVEVIVTYHTFPEEKEEVDPTSSEAPKEDANNEEAVIELESIFPVENAKRAAVVALTNHYALDVFTADGNFYDTSKFHSYKDTSGNFFEYFMNVNSWGTWTPNGQRWHVDSMRLEDSFGSILNISMDVNFDDNNYSVSNISGKFGNNELYVSDTDPAFTSISPELIREDRSQKKTESHHQWVNRQFSVWDGSHKILKEKIIENLNDEKSFKHIETTYTVVYSEVIKDEINRILESSNITVKVEIGDLWITTTFSAKNAFDATIKNIAYGISSYSKDTVTLLAIGPF